MLLAVLTVAVSCASEATSRSDLPLTADRQLRRTDLHLLYVGPFIPTIYRYSAHIDDVVTVTPIDDQNTLGIRSIRSTADRSRTLTLVDEVIEGDTSEIESQVRSVDPAAAGGLGPPIVSASRIDCLGEAAEPGAIGMVVVDDADLFPAEGRWVEVDASGQVSEVRELPPHVLCPVRASGLDRWAFGELHEREPAFEIALVLETAGERRRILWDDCTLQPHEFSADGSRLLVSAQCGGSRGDGRSGLYVFDVATLEPIGGEPIVAGRTTVATWSPDESLVAYTTVPTPGSDATEVWMIRLADGLTHQAGFRDHAWPAWILRTGSEA